MFTLRWLHRKLLFDHSQILCLSIGNCYINSTNRLKLKLTCMKDSVAVFTSVNTLKMPIKSIKFTNYDCLGFDLDNTVCRYKIGSMIKLEYETIAKFLVDQKGYPSKYLMKPIENNLDFMLKGLILDVKNGNILRIASNGHILHGSHGTKELTRQELIKYYGSECHWQATDEFSIDPLRTWNGPYSEEMRTLLDYFDMPAGLIFARAVDSLDEKNGKPLKSYNIWPDLLDGLQDMFQKEHFQLNKGGYFEALKNNPENYIHRCSEDLINWFKNLRKEKKLLFLITGSNVDFASHTAANSLGSNWLELFDIVVCYAKKPGFFTCNRSFIGLSGFEETGPVDEDKLELGQIYTYGNWVGLHKFLKKHSNCENPKIVYIGDNLVQDIYTPAVHTNIDTIAICEELQAEGIFGHDCSHVDKSFLISSRWGSYFGNKYKNHTIWHDIIQKHAKICIPTLEYIAKKPLNYDYTHAFDGSNLVY